MLIQHTCFFYIKNYFDRQETSKLLELFIIKYVHKSNNHNCFLQKHSKIDVLNEFGVHFFGFYCGFYLDYSVCYSYLHYQTCVMNFHF